MNISIEMLKRWEKEGSIEKLKEALYSEDKTIAREAAKILDKISDKSSFELLVGDLKHWNRNTRIRAIDAITKLHKEKAIKPITDCLKDNDNQVRLYAVETMGRIGGEEVIDPLIGVLSDKVRDIRLKAVEILKKIGKPAVEHIVRGLESEDKVVCKNSAWALKEMGGIKTIEEDLKEGHSYSATRMEEIRIKFNDAKKLLKDDMKCEIRNWGSGLIILGVIHLILSRFLDPVWGVIIIFIGILNLIIQERAMFIVNGLALMFAGVMNIFSGTIVWTIGVLQIVWGINEIKKFGAYGYLYEGEGAEGKFENT